MINMIKLRQKRTIQAKIVEQIIIRLFNKRTYFSLLDFLFMNIDRDYDIYYESKELAEELLKEDMDEILVAEEEVSSSEDSIESVGSNDDENY